MTRQALDAGYSSQLLVKYLDNGKITRIRRSVYRLKHFPPGQQEDLVVLWLWSDRAGVFSYDCADAARARRCAARAHLTLPAKWRKRRLRVPEGVVLHYADVPKRDRAWVGAVPVTSPARTLADSAADNVSPEFLSSAVRQALARGMVSRTQATAVEGTSGLDA